MNRHLPRLASFALCALLCASATYWAVTLGASSRSVPEAVMASHPPDATVDDAALLFGGQHDNVNHEIRLLGVMSLGQRAAAILSVGDDAPHVVGLAQPIGNAGTLAEVRTRSIVIEHHGVRSEVFLPSSAQDANIYIR